MLLVVRFVLCMYVGGFMLKEVYNNNKLIYKNYILLIKSGNFYLSFNNDATILNNFFNYKINFISDYIKVGFPEKSLYKVLTKLDKMSINHLVIDKEIILKQKYKNNNYMNYFSNYQVYLNRINNINQILKNNIKYKEISNVLTEVEKILCEINY